VATKNETVADVKPFVITRTFNAPRELVWKAWSEPERLAKWWGPKGSTVGAIKMDFRVGGTNHYSFHFANQDMWGKMYYRELVRPERMVWVNTFSDPKGGITKHPLDPSWPAELLTTVTFQEQGGKTTVTVEWIPINATEAEATTFDEGRKSMTMGWSGTFDLLDAYLASANR
jgi:uncharacterized protein YndB with AHSA1/START domain